MVETIISREKHLVVDGRKVNRSLLKLSIMCISVQDQGSGATTPALEHIMRAFPTIDPSIIMMFSTIPSLCMIIFCPLYAKLQEHMKKRTVLWFCAISFIVSGISPAFMNNVYLILIMRLIQGISIAFMIPMGSDLVCDFFEGQERQTMLGWVNGAMSLGGVLLQVVGGFLANIDWHYCFFAYLISILFFAISLYCLPEPEKIKNTSPYPSDSNYYSEDSVDVEMDFVAESASAEGVRVMNKLSMPFTGWAYTIFHMLFFMCVFAVITNTSSIIVGENISGAGGAGIALALMSFGSFISSLLFGKIFKRLNYNVLPLAFIISIAGFAVGYWGHTLFSMCLMCLFIGIAQGLDLTSVISKCSSIVNDRWRALAISLPLCLGSVGGFCQPWIYDLIHFITGTASVPGRSALLISLIVAVMLTVMVITVNIKDSIDSITTSKGIGAV